MTKALKPLMKLNEEALIAPYKDPSFNSLTAVGGQTALEELWQKTLSPIIAKLKPLLAA